jgi:glycosyltransferase 2 family protein
MPAGGPRETSEGGAGDGLVPAVIAGRRGWRPFLGLAISAVALAGCLIWALDQPAPSFPTSPGALALLAAALGAYATSMGLRGLRWSVILARAGIGLPRIEPYALTLVGYMGNVVLPLRGGEVLRILLVNERSGCGWKAAIGSVIPERLLDVATLAVLLMAVVLSGTIVSTGIEVAAAIGAAILVGGLVAVAVLRRLRAAGRLESFAERIRPFVRASRLLLTPAGIWLGLLTVVIWTLDGAVFWLAAEALGLPIGLPEGIGLAVVATAFSTIPAGPAYAGTWDASLLVALRTLGITGGAAISFVLMTRFVIFVPVTAVGLVIAITRYGGLDRLRRRSRAAREIDPDAVSPTPAPD